LIYAYFTFPGSETLKRRGEEEREREGGISFFGSGSRIFLIFKGNRNELMLTVVSWSSRDGLICTMKYEKTRRFLRKREEPDPARGG